MTQAVLKVEGMSCGHCVSAVEKALEQAGASGKVDLAGKKVAIEYDESRISLEALIAAIEDQGYDVV